MSAEAADEGWRSEEERRANLSPENGQTVSRSSPRPRRVLSHKVDTRDEPGLRHIERGEQLVASVQDIRHLPSGGRFYRADLHIHSFGASHDVSDATMTPQAIVHAAIEHNLHVIAIADHNDIANVRAARAAADKTSLYVVPAVELSTPQGHFLCYLPTIDALQSFVGRLSIADRGTPNSRCQTSILDCLQFLEGLKGFGILAHVDGPSGFETENPGNSLHKRDVLCHKALLAIELKSASSSVSYTDTDPDTDRANIGRLRISQLKLGSKQFLACVLNSDAHTLNALGRNAQGDTKVTRIKMHQPSFDALRIALQDSDARVRIEDQIPASVPYVLGVSFDGGFLDEQAMHFSPNLNCIIGGRGTGKSTAFEAIRCLSGRPSDSDIVDSEIWPSKLDLFWHDQAKQIHALSRPLNGALENVDDPILGPVAFQLESYGQGETAKISRQAHSNPIALLSYLDRFIDIREASEEEHQARNELLTLQGAIEKATTTVNRIPAIEQALATTRQQLKALEQANAREIIKFQRQVAREREVRSEIANRLSSIGVELDSLSPKTAIDALAALTSQDTLTVGAKEFKAILESARRFETKAMVAQSQAKAGFHTFQHEAQANIASWKTKEMAAQKEINDKRKALEAQNIRLDMAYIQKLANDEARHNQDVKNLKAWVPHLSELRRKRKTTSRRRWAARERIATIRDAYAREASTILRSALRDLKVSLKFARSAYSPDAEQQIIEAMGWRTIQVPRAALLIEKLTMPGLVRAIDDKDIAAITGIRTAEGAKVFAKADAQSIIARLADPADPLCPRAL